MGGKNKIKNHPGAALCARLTTSPDLPSKMQEPGPFRIGVKPSGMEIMSAAYTSFVERIACPVSSQGSTSHSKKKGQILQQAGTLDMIRSREKMFSFFLGMKVVFETGIKNNRCSCAFAHKGSFLNRSSEVQLREVMLSVQEAESTASIAGHEY